jgi:hypothetical protein
MQEYDESHPRYHEWVEYCKQQFKWAREANLPEGTLKLPPFHMWVKLQEEEEERLRNRPRIRSDNPPEANRLAAGSIEFKNTIIIAFAVAFIAIELIIVIALPSIPENIRWPGILINLFILLPALYKHSSNEKQADALRALFTLYAFNTEFTLLLADNSTLKTTVYFQIPNDKQYLIEQLNRVTEKELLIFAAGKTKPPPASEFEDHLHLALVQFQNENQLAILRVQIPVHIHIPAKPSQSGELYV